MSSQLLLTIADRLTQVSTDIDELEEVNKDNLQNIYLDAGDINVANDTLEKLLGGNVTKANFVYGLNSLITSSNTKLDSANTSLSAINTSIGGSNTNIGNLTTANHTDLVAIDTSVTATNTSITATNTKLDTIDSVLDNLLLDTTAIKTAVEILDNTVLGNELQVDINNISTIATESTVDDIKTELESIDTHLANLEYGSGSEWYIKTKNNDAIADGADAPSNTPFIPIGGVDANGKGQVLKTSTAGNLLMSVEGAVITDTVRLLSGQDSGVYPQIGTVGIVAGTASIGKVGLNAGTQAIGSVTVTSAPTTAITHSALTALGSSINSNKVDVNLTNASVAVTGSVTSTPSGTQAVSHSGLTELGNAINSNKVDVNLTNASIPVTGTFWQSTQPVSIAGTVEVVQDTSADLKVTEANSSTISTRVNSVITGVNTTNSTLSTTNSKIDTLDGSVDSVKTAVDAIKGNGTSSTLNDLKGVLDSINTNTDTLEVKVAEVDVNTDGLETLQTATNTKLDSTITSVQKIDDVHGADNTTAPTKGILIGGKDSTGKFQDAYVGTTGRLEIDVNSVPTTAVTGTFWQNTQPVSGTVTATPSGTQAISHGALTELASSINSNKLDVNISSGGFDGAVTGTFWQATQPISGTVTETNSGAIKTAVEKLDNAISGSEMQVDVVTMPTTAVTGTFWQTTQPVSGTLAVTNTGLTELANAISGNEMQVDVLTMPTVTETNSSAINTKIGTVNTNLGTLETSTDKVRGTGANVKSLYDLHGLLATINTSASTTATNSANLSNISTKSNNIATSAGAINSDTTSMSNKLTTVNTNLGTLETSTDSIRGSGVSVASLYDLKGVLDAVKTNTDDIEVVVGDIDVNTDGLEVLQASTNTKLDTAITSVAKIDDVHGTDNATAPTKGNLIGGKDTNGKFQDLLVDTSGRPSVNVNGTVPISGTVTSTPSGTQAVSGTFFQATQPVSGTVTATPSGTQAVSNAGLTELASAISGNEMQVDVITMPTVAVTGAFYPGTQPVSGTVTETNSGAIKTAVEKIDNAISGNEMQVDVLTMPTTAVTGAFYPATQPVSGTVTSTPSGTQTVSGTVAVTNAGLTELASAISGNEMQVDVLTMPTITETNSANIKSVLDAIKTNTDDIEVVVGDIDVNTDGLEVLQTSTNTKLDTMDGVLDNIDTASTVGSGFTNGSATIGTSSAQMTSTSFTCNKGVTVTADMSNTGTLYVGNATGVTTSTGFPLEAGDAMFLPIANPTLVYIISDTASQKVLYIAV